MEVTKETYYVEVTDDRVDLDPPYVWQSEEFEDKEEARKLARKIAAAFNRSDVSMLKPNEDYLNPDWEVSAKGVKKHLHVDVMLMEWYDTGGYDIFIEDCIK